MAKKATKLQYLRTLFHTYTITNDDFFPGPHGKVFRAIDEQDRPFAAKVVNGTKTTSERRQRFKEEVSFCFLQSHKNIVPVLDFGNRRIGNKDAPFLIIPRYKGNLRGLNQGVLSSEEVLSILCQILDAVEAGHLNELWHGDLKPENILFDDADQVAVADWGMRHFDSADSNHYAAPEQRLADGHEDYRVDLYSLGLIFREFLTGELTKDQNCKSIGRVRPDLEYLDEVVSSMVAPLPQSRIGSIDEVKRLIALRGEIYLSRQKLDALKERVIPYHKPDDPILRDPLFLTGTYDYRNGVLYLKLSQTVTPGWIISFHSLADGNSVLDRDLHPKNPRSFWFEGDTVCNDIDPANAQRLVDHLKELIQLANKRYKADMEEGARSCQEAESKALERQIEEEKKRLMVIESLRI